MRLAPSVMEEFRKVASTYFGTQNEAMAWLLELFAKERKLGQDLPYNEAAFTEFSQYCNIIGQRYMDALIAETTAEDRIRSEVRREFEIKELCIKDIDSKRLELHTENENYAKQLQEAEKKVESLEKKVLNLQKAMEKSETNFSKKNGG